MSESLNFDLTVTEIPVTMGGDSYILREASGTVACKYRNAMLGKTVLGESGKPVSLKGMADVEPLLVSLCLFKQIPNEETGATIEKPMTVAEVCALPDRVVISLAKKAKEISNLDEEDTKESLKKDRDDLEKREKAFKEEAAKNSQNNTMDGSD